MQVDEERKGEPTKDLMFGGYSDDEEDEREKRELAEHEISYKMTIGNQGALKAGNTLVVLADSHSQTFAKVCYGAEWAQVGTVTRDDAKAKKASHKSVEVVKVYCYQTFYFAVVEAAGGAMANPTQVASQICKGLPDLAKVVVLDSLYKLKYSNPDELYNQPEGKMPMKTYRTSYVAADEAGWLAQNVGTPAHFMAAAQGIGAGCLVECEMNGKPGYQATLITDGHSVTVESMQAFGPLAAHLGLTTTVADIGRAVQTDQRVKTVLREANQSNNTIYL